ncbi:MAG: hypothetical protein ABI854_07665 [Betaproteobacteria bacterium]
MANTAWRDVDWAHTRLQPHVGKVLRIEVWPLSFVELRLRVSATGEWDDASSAPALPVDATLRISPSLLPKLARAPDKPGATLDLTGDPGFVQALREVHDVLPLALEQRLSSLVGPIFAHGISTALQGLATWPAHASDRVGAGIGAYLIEEQGTLVARSAFTGFAADVAALRARVDRLTERG